MRSRLAQGIAAAAALAVLTACSSSGGSSGGNTGSAGGTGSADAKLNGTITVFAAASLTGTFTQLGKQFEQANPGTTVKFSFGSSGDLSTSITQGAPADVFASASPKNMDTVIKAGDAASSSNFVSNTAEIATVPGNPKGITSINDLAKSSIKVALCVLTAPCGALADKIFKTANLTVTPTTREPDVKSTLAVVESKEVDASMVYVTDVKAAGSKVTGVPIPAGQNASTEYPIATLTHSKNPDLANAFISYVKSPTGQQVLKAAGFASP